MSASGQKQTFAVQNAMSALPPESGHVRCKERCPLSANSGHRNKKTASVGSQGKLVASTSATIFGATCFLTEVWLSPNAREKPPSDPRSVI